MTQLYHQIPRQYWGEGKTYYLHFKTYFIVINNLINNFINNQNRTGFGQMTYLLGK